MKGMTLPILAGSLLLAAVPAFAASPATSRPYASDTSFIESAATEYLNKADFQYTDWSQKMADLDMDIMTKKVAVSTQAKAAIDAAWDNLKQSWAQLRTADNQDWDSARAAWQKASDKMQDTWRQMAPQHS